eukprot:scaffold82481_cov17-Tisochrysis_lutea.AAC.1
MQTLGMDAVPNEKAYTARPRGLSWSTLWCTEGTGLMLLRSSGGAAGMPSGGSSHMEGGSEGATCACEVHTWCKQGVMASKGGFSYTE